METEIISAAIEWRRLRRSYWNHESAYEEACKVLCDAVDALQEETDRKAKVIMERITKDHEKTWKELGKF